MNRSWRYAAGAAVLAGPTLLAGIWWRSCPDEARARLAVAAFHVATQTSPVLRAVCRSTPEPGAAEEECDAPDPTGLGQPPSENADGPPL